MLFIALRPSWHCRPNTGTHGQRRGITQPQNSVVLASPSILSDILLHKEMNYAIKTQIVDLIDVSLLPDLVVQAFDASYYQRLQLNYLRTLYFILTTYYLLLTTYYILCITYHLRLTMR